MEYIYFRHFRQFRHFRHLFSQASGGTPETISFGQHVVGKMD
jgi:hypothetical protein